MYIFQKEDIILQQNKIEEIKKYVKAAKTHNVGNEQILKYIDTVEI